MPRMVWIMVGLGGALGAMMRFAVTGWAARLHGAEFPFGTLSVNVLGSLLMGILAALFLLRAPEAGLLRPFLMTGIFGGFTTFSAFSLDAITLFEEQRFLAAILYVLASVLLSILALAAGMAATRSLLA